MLLKYLFVVNFTISLPIMASGFGIRALALKNVKNKIIKKDSPGIPNESNVFYFVQKFKFKFCPYHQCKNIAYSLDY